ncbi:uncharacterized protein LOC101240632 isoform X4 [Hydra vulgaris]|uniref:Uncharacterized protein LOC101240632 isoform X4 n=1 Tax=Hydra vulgaris TaxID=6087 RepID=A0ABM4DA38_HYDVU
MFKSKMEVAQMSTYSPNQHSPYYSSRDLNADSELVTLHPLIIGKHIVVCMPEVNKVLRNVYQVLSQANYYLSKHGISSRRYSGAQLIRIKMLGILGHDAKVCSYILQEDAEMVFDSFDLTGNSRKSSKIVWMDPVLLDEKPMPSPPSKPCEMRSSEIVQEFPIKVHQFRLGDDIIVCTPDVQKVIQVTFNQGAAGYYFSKLGIVPYKFVHSAHLDKIKELHIIKRSAVHCTYVMKEDALKVFDAYGMSCDEVEEKVKFLEVIDLALATPSWKPVKIKNESPNSSIMNATRENSISPRNSTSPKQQLFSPADTEFEMPLDDDGEIPLFQDNDMVVHVFMVENEEVVCMPDIHKIVQSIHGNSIQVNYYFNKLKVHKKRFCFAHLRELKSRNILQNNATYCTYVPRADAEKLFQIYCLAGDPKLSEITYTETINLDSKFSSEDLCDENSSRNPDDKVTIHTFDLDGNVVITTPDVHKLVDFLEEQSASLDYHFRKLGIIKYRFTYSQLHQLRRLNVIKRPTVCTFINKTDVMRLLSMYETERNRQKIKNIDFLEPIVLAPGKNQPSKSKFDFDNSYETQEYQSPSSRQHSPSFVEPPNTTQLSKGEILSPTTTAMHHIQKIHPSIDCPIVIPNGDYDPGKILAASARSMHNGKRFHDDDDNTEVDVYKKYKYNGYPRHEDLMKDLNRKEIELRILHDGYQREIDEEQNRRLHIERKFKEAAKFHKEEIENMKQKQQELLNEISTLREELQNERLIRESLQKESLSENR